MLKQIPGKKYMLKQKWKFHSFLPHSEINPISNPFFFFFLIFRNAIYSKLHIKLKLKKEKHKKSHSLARNSAFPNHR